jgi:hypothetical protein
MIDFSVSGKILRNSYANRKACLSVPCFSTNWICLRRFFACTHHDVILCRACLADGHRSCKDVIVLDIACVGSKTTVLKETDRETKHIIETFSQPTGFA